MFEERASELYEEPGYYNENSLGGEYEGEEPKNGLALYSERNHSRPRRLLNWITAVFLTSIAALGRPILGLICAFVAGAFNIVRNVVGWIGGLVVGAINAFLRHAAGIIFGFLALVANALRKIAGLVLGIVAEILNAARYLSGHIAGLVFVTLDLFVRKPLAIVLGLIVEAISALWFALGTAFGLLATAGNMLRFTAGCLIGALLEVVHIVLIKGPRLVLATFFAFWPGLIGAIAACFGGG